MYKYNETDERTLRPSWTPTNTTQMVKIGPASHQPNYTHPAAQPLPRSPDKNVLNNEQPGWLAVLILASLIAF